MSFIILIYNGLITCDYMFDILGNVNMLIIIDFCIFSFCRIQLHKCIIVKTSRLVNFVLSLEITFIMCRCTQ